MGQAKRKRAAGEASKPAPEPANVVVTELFVRDKATGERISQALLKVNAFRAAKGLKPWSRAAFIGYHLVPGALNGLDVAIAKEEAASRLVVTPDEARRALARP